MVLLMISVKVDSISVTLTSELLSKAYKLRRKAYFCFVLHSYSYSLLFSSIFARATLLKMFSPFGKIVSEDFLWHTRGPKRGEPRGFAFIQYSTKGVG